MTLECTVNISEGTDLAVLEEIGSAAGEVLLDVHHNRYHNRSVFTLASLSTESLMGATERLAAKALELIDLSRHTGVHPRLGVVDLVPFSPLGPPPFDLTEALACRRRFAEFAASVLHLPCFFYGPERELPEVRRRAFVDLEPDLGPGVALPTAGACCVAARPPLVAYNVVLEQPDLALAQQVSSEIRSASVRALGFEVGGVVQVSCNLVAPFAVGPAAVFDEVARRAPVARAELVGLIPEEVLAAAPRARWAELDLSAEKSLEGRLAAKTAR